MDLYSKRRKGERGEVPDVYTYDDLPQPLRVQFVHIIRDAFQASRQVDPKAGELYQEVHDMLAREYGVFELHKDAKGAYPDYPSALFNFLLGSTDVEKALDVIELCLRCAVVVIPRWHYEPPRVLAPDAVIAEANARFKEHGVGYQFESLEIIRVDSQHVHAEVVKPVLNLLASPGFEGPNQEYLKAHEHYRHGRHKEALVEALKALESTVKVICAQRGWAYDSGATAKRLVEVCFDKGLISQYLQAHFGALRSTLETGIPTVRNKLGGHGQGEAPMVVPDYIVEYGLNLTASAILLLSRAHESAG